MKVNRKTNLPTLESRYFEYLWGKIPQNVTFLLIFQAKLVNIQ
jgi:hypothetical protein